MLTRRYAIFVALACACSTSPMPVVDAAGDTRLDAMSDAAVDATATDATDAVVAPSDAFDTRIDSGPPAGFGRRCDPSHTCPAGLRCESGTCHLDCASAPHCGTPETCCAPGQACSPNGCVAPGAACTPAPGCGGAGVATCPVGSYCDGALLRCLPTAAMSACVVPPSTSMFNPVEYWHWTGSHDHPEFKGVLVTPIVADVNHDGAGDVLVVAYRDPPASFGGVTPGYSILCALSGPGDCAGGPREIFCTDPTDPTQLLAAWANIAVADLDATDGVDRLTIIAGRQHDPTGALGIIAFDEHGTRRWVGHNRDGTEANVYLYLGAPAIADLDGDGHAEIIVGATVFDDTGTVRWTAPGTHNGPANIGPISLAVDLDGAPDGHLEVLSGNAAYHFDGTPYWTSNAAPDGYDAVADFDGDGHPEVVVVGNSSITVLTYTGALYAPTVTFASLAVRGRGGPPTIADIDQDGHPEIGVAAGDHYLTFKLVADATSSTGHALHSFWMQPANDLSSSVTASGMFDFRGDGRFEVIYQDTCRARVMDGTDGHALMDIPNVSGTATNYPTVADVNGDGRAEFILVTDSYYNRTFPGSDIACPASTPMTDGVRVFRDMNDSWQTTRAIWNEHTYHVTNVCDGVDMACSGAANTVGAIPRHEASSFAGGLNEYRVNARQGIPAINAPDLLPLSVSTDASACPTTLTIVVDVANQGAAAVAAGTPIAFYDGDPSGAHTLLGTALTMRAIAPGGVERVTFAYSVPVAMQGATFHAYVVVDDDGMGHPRYRECNVTNNTSQPVTIACASIG